jgi:hypothetical protein
MRAGRGKAFADRILATLAIVLIPIVAADALHALADTGAVDFYHLWGVPVAHDALGSDPYAATQAYAAHLNGVAERSTSAKLHATNEKRREILPTGTPSFYALFSVLPHDFDRALASFVVAQYAAFIAAVTLLARAYGRGLAAAGVIGAGAALVFTPFSHDVSAGNVNSFQLLAVAFLVWLSAARSRLPDPAFRYGFPAALGALAVFKPNIAWILMFLAVHFVIVTERVFLPRAVLAAALAALLLACVGAAYFGGPAAWEHWLEYARGSNGGGIVFTLAQGNHSMVEFLAEVSPRIGLARAQLAMTGLGLGLLAFVALRGRDQHARARGLALLADARIAAACGAVLTLAASPLVWPHYHVLAILPLACLVSGRAGWVGWILAALSGLAYFEPVVRPIWPAQVAWVPVLVLLAWVPLAAGLCVTVARMRERPPQDGTPA